MSRDGAGYLRIMSILGHELRTPLTVIRGASTLVLQAYDQLPPERLRELLRLVDENSETMAERIEDLLTLSHLDAGDLGLQPAEVALDDVITPAVESARRQGQAGVEVEGQPEGAVEADREKAMQALRALLGVATKAAGRGRLVTLRLVPAEDEVRFEIVQPGREQGWGRRGFLEGVNTAAQLESGLELNLYLARGLARAMAGDVGPGRDADGRTLLWFRLRRYVGSNR